MGTERENSELANSVEGAGRNWRIVLPGKRMSEIIRADLITTTSYVVSDEVDVWKSSRVYIYATITTDGAGGIVSMVPEVSGSKTHAEEDFFPLFREEIIGNVDACFVVCKA